MYGKWKYEIPNQKRQISNLNVFRWCNEKITVFTVICH